MGETASSYEREARRPLSAQIAEVMDRRATRGDRRLILDTYKDQFEQLIRTLPKEKRDTVAIKIQKFFVSVSGFLSEYGARFTDFVRNVFVSPMLVSGDFPHDKYYQLNLSRAKAWGEFARDTTKTATAERMNYRDHFLPAALSGIPTGGLLGAVALGTFEGAKYGTLAAGAAGAVVGAGLGAVGGLAYKGAESLFYKAKDAIIGPPVIYYNLNSFIGPSFTLNKSETPQMPIGPLNVKLA
jgi:hypothetical protein